MNLAGVSAHQMAIRMASEQAGVVARRQLVSIGWSDQAIIAQLHAGRWQNVGRGAYATFTGEVPDRAWWWAAHLMVGDLSALTGLTALRAMGLQLRRRAREIEQIALCVPHSVRPRSTDSQLFVVRTRTMPPLASKPKLPPLVKAEYAFLQAADWFRSDREVIDLFSAVVQQRMATPLRIARAAKIQPRLRHRALLNKLVAQADEGSESPLEVQGTQRILRAHGLPVGRGQVVGRANGRRVVRDRQLVPYAVFVEYDGRLGHDDSEGRFRDMKRDNAAALTGFITLRFGWIDVTERPCEAAYQVAQALSLAGWPGLPTPCGKECQLLGTISGPRT